MTDSMNREETPTVHDLDPCVASPLIFQAHTYPAAYLTMSKPLTSSMQSPVCRTTVSRLFPENSLDNFCGNVPVLVVQYSDSQNQSQKADENSCVDTFSVEKSCSDGYLQQNHCCHESL